MNRYAISVTAKLAAAILVISALPLMLSPRLPAARAADPLFYQRALQIVESYMDTLDLYHGFLKSLNGFFDDVALQKLDRELGTLIYRANQAGDIGEARTLQNVRNRLRQTMAEIESVAKDSRLPLSMHERRAIIEQGVYDLGDNVLGSIDSTNSGFPEIHRDDVARARLARAEDRMGDFIQKNIDKTDGSIFGLKGSGPPKGGGPPRGDPPRGGGAPRPPRGGPPRGGTPFGGGSLPRGGRGGRGGRGFRGAGGGKALGVAGFIVFGSGSLDDIPSMATHMLPAYSALLNNDIVQSYIQRSWSAGLDYTLGQDSDIRKGIPGLATSISPSGQTLGGAIIGGDLSQLTHPQNTVAPNWLKGWAMETNDWINRSDNSMRTWVPSSSVRENYWDFEPPKITDATKPQDAGVGKDPVAGVEDPKDAGVSEITTSNPTSTSPEAVFGASEVFGPSIPPTSNSLYEQERGQGSWSTSIERGPDSVLSTIGVSGRIESFSHTGENGGTVRFDNVPGIGGKVQVQNPDGSSYEQNVPPDWKSIEVESNDGTKVTFTRGGPTSITGETSWKIQQPDGTVREGPSSFASSPNAATSVSAFTDGGASSQQNSPIFLGLPSMDQGSLSGATSPSTRSQSPLSFDSTRSSSPSRNGSFAEQAPDTSRGSSSYGGSSSGSSSFGSSGSSGSSSSNSNSGSSSSSSSSFGSSSSPSGSGTSSGRSSGSENSPEY